jgi:TRAP-type uncharacterized transport system substrate-binding protein
MARLTSRRQGARGCLGLVCIIGIVGLVGCAAPRAVTTRDAASSRAVLRIGADPFISSLAEEFSRVSQVEIRHTGLPGGALPAAIQRNEVDLALVPANTAYFSYVEGAQSGVSPDDQLRVISALQVTPFILVVRPESGIRDVRGLRGHTIARFGVLRPPSAAPREPAAAQSPPPSAFDSMRVTELVLSAFGVLDEVRIVSGLTVDEITTGFRKGTLDAAYGTAYFLPEMFSALTAAGARLVPIEGAEIDGLVQRFPFIRRTLVARDTYPGQASAVRTVGVDLLLVCRSGLDPDLVYDLTRQYFASLPALLAATHTVSRVDLERAAATPIPLHDGAARYYRESELYR